jgi:UDP-glucuronate 4-epimerase
VRDTPSAPYQIVQAARSGGPAILPRSHRRDWLYARDAAATMIELLYARTRRHRVYNLAAGFLWSIADFCARLQQVYPGLEWRFAQQGEAASIDYYAAMIALRWRSNACEGTRPFRRATILRKRWPTICSGLARI